MPSPLDPQLDAVLAALAARLGSGVEDAIFVGQDDLPHGQGALIEPLLRCGLLIPAQPATATICEGCERCCIMAVQFAPPRPGESARGFIVCDKRDDIGRVAVPSEGLRRWTTSWQGIARLLAKALGIVGEPVQVAACRHWLLGSINRRGKSVEVACRDLARRFRRERNSQSC